MFIDLVRKNRSCRGFDESRSIRREELLEMVECARCSASTANAQVLKFYISNEKEETERILACTKWAGALPELKLPFPGTHPVAFIVILQDKRINDNMARFMMDAGIAAQSITLAATEKELGACMIRSFAMDQLKGVLALPEELVPLMVIALGAPAEEIRLETLEAGASTAYYRTDDNHVHHVPKRKLEDIVLFKAAQGTESAV